MAAKRKSTSKIAAAREALASLSYAEIVELAATAAADAKERETDWRKVIRTCPRCGKTGAVDPMFGVKTTRGIVGAQSWCSSCRAETAREYRAKARVNLKRK